MKILYVTTIGETMRFFKSLVKELTDKGHTVDIATNDTENKVDGCYNEWGCKIYTVSCSRSPLKKDNLTAIKQIREIVQSGRYDTVHCHTPIAAACTRLACSKLRKSGVRVIYTAHGFHFYKGAPLVNWLIYYPIEWFCSFKTDDLITINKEDYERAKKRLHAKRTHYVPGVGVDIQKFAETQVDKSAKRKEIGVPEDAFMLLSVGELNKNKNHQVVIKALAKLNNSDIHYVIAGQGDLKDELWSLACSLGLEKQFHLLGQRNDVAQLFKSADVNVIPSIREGLVVVGIEGMASGLPLICSDNRGIRDFAKSDNAILCSAFNEDDFCKAISKLYKSDIGRTMGENASKMAQNFDVELINKKMRDIYENRK